MIPTFHVGPPKVKFLAILFCGMQVPSSPFVAYSCLASTSDDSPEFPWLSCQFIRIHSFGFLNSDYYFSLILLFIGMRVGSAFQATIPPMIGRAPGKNISAIETFWRNFSDLQIFLSAPPEYEPERAVLVWSPRNNIPDHECKNLTGVIFKCAPFNLDLTYFEPIHLRFHNLF